MLPPSPPTHNEEGCTHATNDERRARKKMTQEFFMPMIPPTITHQQHKVAVRNGKPVIYEPQELRNARMLLLENLRRRRPQPCMRVEKGPVELLVKWCFPVTGSHSDGEYRTSRPDTDNLQKLLKDCMTSAGFWRDDAQVAREIVEKFWSDLPGIYVRVSALEVA